MIILLDNLRRVLFDLTSTERVCTVPSSPSLLQLLISLSPVLFRLNANKADAIMESDVDNGFGSVGVIRSIIKKD